MIRGIRGATTVENNDETEILSATSTLLTELIKSNNIDPEYVASVFISVTEEIDAVFPAKALRSFVDWKYVPVTCMKEIPVKNSLTKCIRIMLHLNTSKSQAEIQHVYLDRATSLRPDLKTK